MAHTAVVNPRGRDGRFKKGGSRKRRRNPRRSSGKRRHRRRNYGAAAAINPRRRRRHYGGGRRRRNPITPYASQGYYRQPNPAGFNMDDITEVVPAATGGIWAARFALKQAGAFEPAKDGTLEPGLKHAIAIYIGAVLGGQLVGSLMGPDKEHMAKIAALGFGGDLFLRARFMRDSEFVQKNLSLQGLGDADDTDYVSPLDGFQSSSPIAGMGAPTMVDAFGNLLVSTPQGWQLAGGMGQDVQYVTDPEGNVFALSGAQSGAVLGGFQSRSPIAGMGNVPSQESSFGYARR
jgi:hypothetical protein